MWHVWNPSVIWRPHGPAGPEMEGVLNTCISDIYIWYYTCTYIYTYVYITYISILYIYLYLHIQTSFPNHHHEYTVDGRNPAPSYHIYGKQWDKMPTLTASYQIYEASTVVSHKSNPISSFVFYTTAISHRLPPNLGDILCHWTTWLGVYFWKLKSWPTSYAR